MSSTQSSDSQGWLSIIEYARKHQISDMTIRRRIRTGRIKAVLKEGKYYIPAETSVEAFKPQEPMSFHFEGAKKSPQEPSELQERMQDFIKTGDLMLNRLEQYEENLERRYLAEKALLEAKLQDRDQTISRLSQDIEDLKFLISMMEKDLEHKA